MAGDDGSEDTEYSEPSVQTGQSVDVAEFLAEVGFDASENVLTRRQAEVVVLRERGYSQSTIADRLGTSRANVSSIEGSARENIAKARETVRFAELVSPPVEIEIAPGTELYDVPEMVFDACDEVDVKVTHSASELMRIVSEAAEDAIEDRRVRSRFVVHVTADGTVWVRGS